MPRQFYMSYSHNHYYVADPVVQSLRERRGGTADSSAQFEIDTV